MTRIIPTLLAAVASASATAEKIALGPDNVLEAFGVSWYNSSGKAVLDEQAVAGDPANSGGGKCVVAWQPTWDETWYGPQIGPFVLVDLNATYDVSSVFMYRDWGSINVTVAIGAANPFDIVHVFSLVVGQTIPVGQGWANASVPAGTAVGRWATISVAGPTGSSMLEFVFYGTLSAPLAPATPPAAAAPLPAPPLRMLLGANGFANAGADNLTAIGALREYQDWEWTEHVQDANAFQPTYDVDFALDTWYASLAGAGIAGHMCMQKSPQFLHPGNESGWKPLTAAQLATPGTSTAASSYARPADHAFQVAARYGANASVPASMLKLKAGQAPLVGAGTMRTLELFNEPDGTWNGGRNGFFAPYEYAAMLSAAYDGHCGSMGAGMGARAADAGFRVAMAGIAGINVQYLEAMRLWAAAHRPCDGAFPAQIINVHTYSNNAPVGGTATVGISPEEDSLAAKMTAVCAWRDRWLPDREVWLSEFGYDTDAASPQAAPAVGPFSGLQVQGQWLIRAVLALASTGCVSRAHMYMLADVTTGAPWKFATSGLLTNPGFTAKPSWYYYSTFLQYLGNATFTSMPAPVSQAVAVACFAVPSPGGFAAVLWSPTTKGVSVANYALSDTVCGGAAASAASWVRLVDDSASGNSTALPVASGTITVPLVTESPAIVLLQ